MTKSFFNQFYVQLIMKACFVSKHSYVCLNISAILIYYEYASFNYFDPSCDECFQLSTKFHKWYIVCIFFSIHFELIMISYIFKMFLRYIQGMVDGSASKPPLKQNTGYVVEKTYLDIAPYLGAFFLFFKALFRKND